MATIDRLRRGAVLALPGMLWGLNLIKLGLSSSLAMASPQIGQVSQIGLLVAFVGTFLFLAFRPSVVSDLFGKRGVLAGFSAAFVIGSLQLMMSFDGLPVPNAIPLAFTLTCLHAAANVFFLCGVAALVASRGRSTIARSLGIATAIACVIFALGAALSPFALRLFFEIVLLAFVAAFWAFGKIESSAREEKTGAPDARMVARHAVYGLALGFLPTSAPVEFVSPVENWLFSALALAVIALGSLVLYSSKSSERGVPAMAGIVLVLLNLLPFGIAFSSLVWTSLMASWLLFWIFLCCLLPFARPKGERLPFCLFLAAFALGRLFAEFQPMLSLFSPGFLLFLILLSASFSLATPIAAIMTTRHAAKRDQKRPAPIVEDSSREASHDELANTCAVLAERYQLTAREREILMLLAQGRGRQFISSALVISEGTAKTHIKHIYAKLGVHSKDELLNLFHGPPSS